LLGSLGGRKLKDDHFNEGLSSVDPLLEDTFEKKFRSQFLFLRSQGNAESLEHLPDGIKIIIHDVTAELDDWAHDELDEASLETLAILSLTFSLESLGAWVEVIVTPELLHESFTIQLELL